MLSTAVQTSPLTFTTSELSKTVGELGRGFFVFLWVFGVLDVV